MQVPLQNYQQIQQPLNTQPIQDPQPQVQAQNNTPKLNRCIKKYSVHTLTLYISVTFIAGIILPYLSGRHFNQIEPFGEKSLTQNILHYPGFALFRMCLVPSFVLSLFFGYIVIHWIKVNAEKNQVSITNTKTLKSSLIVAVLFSFLTISSIDQYEMNYEIYSYAVAFAYGFGFNFIYLITLNIVKIKKKDPNFITDKSYYYKLTVALALLIQSVLAFTNGYVWDLFEQKDKNGLNQFGYYYTLSFFLFFPTFLTDLEDMYLEFNLETMPSVNLSYIR